MRDEVIENIVHQCIPENSFYSEWDSEKIKKDVMSKSESTAVDFFTLVRGET